MKTLKLQRRKEIVKKRLQRSNTVTKMNISIIHIQLSISIYIYKQI